MTNIDEGKWFQHFGTSQNTSEISISTFFQKKIKFSVSILYYSW